MKSLKLLAVAALLGACPQAFSESRVLELAFEATAEDVRMPASATSELTLQGCVTCQVLRLRASENTRYVIGNQQVSLAEMTRYLQRNPEAGVVVMQRKGTSELSRVTVLNPPRAQ